MNNPNFSPNQPLIQEVNAADVAAGVAYYRQINSDYIPYKYQSYAPETVKGFLYAAQQAVPGDYAALKLGAGQQDIVITPVDAQVMARTIKQKPWELTATDETVSKVVGQWDAADGMSPKDFESFIKNSTLRPARKKSMLDDFRNFRRSGISWKQRAQAPLLYRQYHQQRLALHEAMQGFDENGPFEPTAEPLPVVTPEIGERSIGLRIGLMESSSHADGSQDRSLVDTDRRVFGVFDGMGGEQSGAEAAEIVRATVARVLGEKPQPQTAEEAAKNLHEAFMSARQAWEKRMGELGINDGGTTATVGQIVTVDGEDHIVYRTAGDSVLMYYANEDGSIYISKEQNMPNEPNRIYNAIAKGCDGTKDECLVKKLQPGDKLLFATDGITGDWPSERLSKEDYEEAFAIDDPERCAKVLHADSKKYDDKTALVVYYDGPQDQARSKAAEAASAVMGRMSHLRRKVLGGAALFGERAKRGAAAAKEHFNFNVQSNRRTAALVGAAAVVGFAAGMVFNSWLNDRDSSAPTAPSSPRPTSSSSAPVVPGHNTPPSGQTAPEDSQPGRQPERPKNPRLPQDDVLRIDDVAFGGSVKATPATGKNHTLWAVAERQVDIAAKEAGLNRLSPRARLLMIDAVKDKLLAVNDMYEGKHRRPSQQAARLMQVGAPIATLPEKDVENILAQYA